MKGKSNNWLIFSSVGFQIIAKPNADGDVFVCAATVETAVSLTDRWPNI